MKFASALIDDNLYLFGGIDSENTNNILNDVQYININSTDNNLTPTPNIINHNTSSVYDTIIINTEYPTLEPTFNPVFDPTVNPTLNPTIYPTLNPSWNPSLMPTLNPTLTPTLNPTVTYDNKLMINIDSVTCYMYYIGSNNVISSTMNNNFLIFAVFGSDWSVLLQSNVFLHFDLKINA
eukprot:428964_1